VSASVVITPPAMQAVAAMGTPTEFVANPGHIYDKRFRGARR
jgi:hypothetical protein